MTELERLEKQNDEWIIKIQKQLTDINNLIKEINNGTNRGTKTSTEKVSE